jgi:hypothetical protein
VIDSAIHAWLNIATLLVIVGGCFYASLIPYMMRDE